MYCIVLYYAILDYVIFCYIVLHYINSHLYAYFCFTILYLIFSCYIINHVYTKLLGSLSCIKDSCLCAKLPFGLLQSGGTSVAFCSPSPGSTAKRFDPSPVPESDLWDWDARAGRRQPRRRCREGFFGAGSWDLGVAQNEPGANRSVWSMFALTRASHCGYLFLTHSHLATVPLWCPASRHSVAPPPPPRRKLGRRIHFGFCLKGIHSWGGPNEQWSEGDRLIPPRRKLGRRIHFGFCLKGIHSWGGPNEQWSEGDRLIPPSDPVLLVLGRRAWVALPRKFVKRSLCR